MQQRHPAILPEEAEGIGFADSLDRRRRQAGAPPQLAHRRVAVAALLDQPPRVLLTEALDLPEAEAQGRSAVPRALQRAVPIAVIDVDPTTLDRLLARIAADLRRRV